jgi:hypothetical protein
MALPTTFLVRAKQYGSDTNAKLTVAVDNQEVSVLTTTTVNQDFTVNIPAKTSSSVISMSALSIGRVYVDYVKLTTQASVKTAVSFSGYPKSVGNVLTYSVSGLQSDSTYYYTITPEGNAVAFSNQIQVHTNLSSGLTDNQNNAFRWSILSDGIQIHNLLPTCQLTVYDYTGKSLQTIHSNTSDVKILLHTKGIYIIQVLENQKTECFKLIY